MVRLQWPGPRADHTAKVRTRAGPPGSPPSPRHARRRSAPQRRLFRVERTGACLPSVARPQLLSSPTPPVTPAIRRRIADGASTNKPAAAALGEHGRRVPGGPPILRDPGPRLGRFPTRGPRLAAPQNAHLRIPLISDSEIPLCLVGADPSAEPTAPGAIAAVQIWPTRRAAAVGSGSSRRVTPAGDVGHTSQAPAAPSRRPQSSHLAIRGPRDSGAPA